MSLPKKIFVISSALLAAVLFFLGIYNISFKDKSAGPKTDENQVPKSNEKSVIEKVEDSLGMKNKDKIYRLTDEAITSPVFMNDEEKIKYYTKLSGSVYSISKDGSKNERVDDNNLTGLESVKWSSEQNKVISRFNNNGKIHYWMYDYGTKKSVKLSDGIEYVIWNSVGDGIVYKYSDAKTGKKNISVANSDGSNWKKIVDIQTNNPIMSLVPQSSFVSYWNGPNSFDETLLYLVSTMSGEPRKIFSGRYGADYLWSPNGTKALVSSAESRGAQKMTLGVINSNGGEYQNLNIPTFASKCVWSNDNKTVYYALPIISEKAIVLPNDYQDRKIFSKDTFWKADVTTGKTERVAEITDIKDVYDAENLFLSPSEDILFFINRTDGKLFGINL